ncbi:hypothetical protein ACFSKY_05415 [Azotobacter chroococcum]|jgi:hypothetical protein|uniref:Uncharacterized protein n=1 Tax=Azotobacter chroococcum TaxID=353 RepID=A0A4R1NT79_9GAMM|nr:hypothetical protein [Azotobacter chroococcum]TBV92743.1 hypothetical protein E0E53_17990 [Azotobacter chroococcum]TBW01786.1 hypothetical protein E0E52_19010 [Azotobacter chroococcum]TCL15542.1 hypothetical protein EV691_15816 [Azotobacter chroococcum]
MLNQENKNTNLEALKNRLSPAINQARSLKEIESWIRSQPSVKSVELADHLLKSNPPQREFFVELKMEDGTTVKKIINIFELGNQRFKFHKLHEQP